MQGASKKMKRLLARAFSVTLCLFMLCSCSPKVRQSDAKEDENPIESKPTEESVTVNYGNKSKVKFSDIEESIIINGRCPFEENGDMLLSWSNSGVEIAGWFNGKVTVYYRTDDEGVHLHTVADGDDGGERLVTLQKGEHSFVAANFNKAGYHTVAIYKADEGKDNKLWLKSAEFFGRLDEEPVEKTLSIEIIGDSISCGTALIGADGLADDAFFSYGARLARSIRARLSIVAVSGWGLNCGIRNFDNAVPKIYGETAHFAYPGKMWDFSSNPVDAVIVNLGTNDYTQYYDKDRTELLEAANAFFDKLRGYYPDAHIYFTYGMMSTVFLEDFINLAESRGDDNMEFVKVRPNTEGILSHPISRAHEEYAHIFENLMRKQYKLSAKITEYDEAIERKKAVTVITEE